MKMDDNFKKSFERATALQNLWVDSMTGMAKSWSDYSPSNDPGEEMKKARQRMLGAVSKSWEDFMRTPEFLDMMRESMGHAASWGAQAKAGASRMHETMGTASKQDIDGVLLAIRHVEKRVLDRLETLQELIEGLEADLSSLNAEHADEINDSFQQELMKKLGAIEATLTKKVAPAPRASTVKTPAKKAAAKKSVTKVARKTASKTTRRK